MRQLFTSACMAVLIMGCSPSNEKWISADGKADHKDNTLTLSATSLHLHLSFKNKSKTIHFEESDFDIVEVLRDPNDQMACVYVLKSRHEPSYYTVMSRYTIDENTARFTPYDAYVLTAPTYKQIKHNLRVNHPTGPLHTFWKRVKTEGQLFKKER